MHRFYISVPVWGKRCTEVFCATALPAIERAALLLGTTDVRLVVHTDNPKPIVSGATQIDVDTRPLPAGLRDFDCLSQSHREVLHMASKDDRVCFLTADLVVSENSFVFCDNRLSEEKRLIACAGTRALQEGHINDGDTKSGMSLLKWAWKNRHPMTEACLWPNGKSVDLSRIYFQDKDNVVARLCLPHPICIKKDGRSITFSPTVDANLIQNYHQNEIHLVTEPRHLAMVELSPRDKGFGVSTNSMFDKWSEDQIMIPDPLQRWLFQHRIVIVGGDVDCGDEEFAERIMEKCDV